MYFKGIMNLMLEGGSAQQNFYLNAIGGTSCYDDMTFIQTVQLRVSRVNQNCNPNAGAIYDNNARVKKSCLPIETFNREKRFASASPTFL